MSDEEMAQLASEAFADLENCPLISISLDPHDAFVLGINLPLIFMHPANQEGPAMEAMQKLFWTLQELFAERSSAAFKVLELSSEGNPYLTQD